MGEAKRKNVQLKQVQADLQRRLDAGEFGNPCSCYCIVLDKSARGRETLQALRGLTGRLVGLGELLDAEPMQLWEASPLFRFVALAGGDGKPHERSFVAADLDRLLADALPRALRRAARHAGPAGTVIGVDTDAEAAVKAALTAAR
ncbi:hypothetical protein M8A51_14700 [Schlegelella sp. S2-27]|uniref:Uncharacterized protein n=1 Tax=Caldimonas mangrovi TaxID=2944811 RepID=A0ABT0YPW9_9BURK|nr:hypothetical protein [Caldimonas mangrovi]MCM5680771.1 hypothetical protein [Caldimonas mangrovi]